MTAVTADLEYDQWLARRNAAPPECTWHLSDLRKPVAHHAVLIVNAAMTFSNFIFDTHSYQKAQRHETPQIKSS